MGFLKITWGQEGVDPAPVPPGADPGPVIDNTAAALEVIREAVADAADPFIDESVKNNKLAWVGGAVAIYAKLTGEDPNAVLGLARQSPGSGAGAARYTDIVSGTVVPVKRERPGRHPGAQRAVSIGPDGEEVSEPFAVSTSLVPHPES